LQVTSLERVVDATAAPEGKEILTHFQRLGDFVVAAGRGQRGRWWCAAGRARPVIAAPWRLQATAAA